MTLARHDGVLSVDLAVCCYGLGRKELLTGSDDFAIRVFREEEVVGEITEAEKVTHLCRVEPQRFAYALVNGTVGLYHGTKRVWRVKSKHKCIAMTAFDLDGDGVPEVSEHCGGGRFDHFQIPNGSCHAISFLR